MKNILLLGNGFDLYYKLPTKYADFLQVVDFLQKHHKDAFATIGDVFAQQTLQQSDPFIKACYIAHQKTYDTTSLNQDIIADIVKLTENNSWFSYFIKVFNKDVGWIDFEKEISFVLECFAKTFAKSTVLHFKSEEKYVKGTSKNPPSIAINSKMWYNRGRTRKGHFKDETNFPICRRKQIGKIE